MSACWFDRSTIFQTRWLTATLRCLTSQLASLARKLTASRYWSRFCRFNESSAHYWEPIRELCMLNKNPLGRIHVKSKSKPSSWYLLLFRLTISFIIAAIVAGDRSLYGLKDGNRSGISGLGLRVAVSGSALGRRRLSAFRGSSRGRFEPAELSTCVGGIRKALPLDHKVGPPRSACPRLSAQARLCQTPQHVSQKHSRIKIHMQLSFVCQTWVRADGVQSEPPAVDSARTRGLTGSQRNPDPVRSLR